jgi:hypothetical protein
MFRDGWTDRQANSKSDIQTVIEIDRQSYRWTDRHTDGQIVIQMDRRLGMDRQNSEHTVR